jgi:DNA gyrase subunit A
MADSAIEHLVNIEDEMRSSYLDYAMSVIVGRALPDVRDGMKPVHRRILYAMYTEGLLHNKKYSKCAGVVGEVLKKYHPHGDAAVYDTLVRMAQGWNMRYPLVDGQGNFGSIDGDPPAAYRYTECRMTRIAEEMLADIEKDTVDFVPNFDSTTEEPALLPSRIPNLMVNGSTGIAVGMATNIPPHNLHETVQACIHLIRNPQATVEELMKFIPGPDFPTGGIIYGTEGLRQAYATGRGILTVRGKVFEETHPRTGKQSIVISEIPYQVNKARLIERIAELVREKKIQGIADVRDESDREGIRVVVELKKDAMYDIVLNQLYKHTPLQSSFGVIMLALVGGQPRVLDLKQMLQHYLDHRREVIRRRSSHELKLALERRHILEGLRIALDQIDLVIELIRNSKDPDQARARLMEKLGLSEKQAQAILDMRLQRLTGLEREKILAELEQLAAEIEKLRAILASPARLMEVVIGELEQVDQAYADQRRTAIVADTQEITIEDLVADVEQAVTVSHAGYIKRTPLELYRRQRRGGRGRSGMQTREEDFVEKIFIASTHSTILIFTDNGRAHALKVYEIPESAPATRGTSIYNLVRLKKEEKIVSLVAVRSFEEEAESFLGLVTERGQIKKTALKFFDHITQAGIRAININEGDRLIGASIINRGQEIIISTRQGMAVRFQESDLRPMGRAAAGVRGIRLKKEDDRVVSMEVVSPGSTILTVMENGYGKRTLLDEYRLTSRGGVGVKTCRITEKTGPVVGVMQVAQDDDLMLITDGGMVIRTRVSDVPVLGRDTQGVRLIDLKEGERVTALARLAERGEEEETA